MKLPSRSKRIILFLCVCAHLVLCLPQKAIATPAEATSLNDAGVAALGTGDCVLAIQKLETALKLDPSFQQARDNLATAWNSYGLRLLPNQPKEAIKAFHESVYLDRNKVTAIANLENNISRMGKNPRSFSDRVALGDDARKNHDFVGAVIEYSEGLKINDDAKTHEKLGDTYRIQEQEGLAVEQYLAAARSHESVEIVLKLGQAYQAKSDWGNARNAYMKASAIAPNDPDVQAALASLRAYAPSSGAADTTYSPVVAGTGSVEQMRSYELDAFKRRRGLN